MLCILFQLLVPVQCSIFVEFNWIWEEYNEEIWQEFKHCKLWSISTLTLIFKNTTPPPHTRTHTHTHTHVRTLILCRAVVLKRCWVTSLLTLTNYWLGSRLETLNITILGKSMEKMNGKFTHMHNILLRCCIKAMLGVTSVGIWSEIPYKQSQLAHPFRVSCIQEKQAQNPRTPNPCWWLVEVLFILVLSGILWQIGVSVNLI